MKLFKYGMRLRGFSPGAQPKEHFVERRDDTTGLYHDIIVYSQRLSFGKCMAYDLDYLGEEDEGSNRV